MDNIKPLRFILKLESRFHQYRIWREEQFEGGVNAFIDIIDEFKVYDQAKNKYQEILNNINVRLFSIVQCTNSETESPGRYDQSVEYEANFFDLGL